MRALVDEPDRPLSEVARCDERTLARLAGWGTGPARELPSARLLPELFRRRAERTPDATALVAEDEEWSYAALLTAVEEIAAALRAAGVSPGDRIAVLVDRGGWLVAALLGVLAAAAAYVPLDPGLPADRLGYMIEDSGTRLLLSQRGLRERWPSGLPVLAVDDLAAGVTGTAIASPAGAAAGDTRTSAELAYVLYTSGSTGSPKGVAVAHRSLVNLLLSMTEETGFTAADSLLAVTTVSFDIAGLELFMPLLAGGRVIVCGSDTAADVALLAARIESSGATWMQATPASWRMLREAGWQGAHGLNILCGGEELPDDLAEYLTGRARSVRNAYGPTETTIWSASGPVDPGRGVDIGAPLANTQLYVLDAQGRCVEPGFPGELWIGGDGHVVDRFEGDRHDDEFTGLDTACLRTGATADRCPAANGAEHREGTQTWA